MTPNDHSADLERIAEQTGHSPLVVLEMFIERSAIREYLGGMARSAAELAALAEVAEIFAEKGRHLPSDASKRSARPADATDMNVQPGGSCSPVAIGER